MDRLYDKAIVIGGSIAGLMAARALSDYFKEVVVFDRDKVPDGPEPRKCVPQGQHVHAMLEAGIDVLDRFFPGIVADMQRDGVNVIDLTNDVAWHHFGVWKVRCESGLRMLLFTRPFLEHRVRERLKAAPNVELRHEVTVKNLLHSADRSTITGVVLEDGSQLRADVVVDASGRGSRAPAWLEELGYARPIDEEVGIDLSYTSCLYKPSPRFKGEWKLLVEYPRSPGSWRAGFISCVEGDRWIVSLNGYFKAAPELTRESFLDFAKSLPRPDLYDYIKDAEPLTEPVTHKIPTNRWRHYEKLSRFPEGLIPIGDSVCALNPIFGQGMSAASMEADLLQRALAEHARANPHDMRGLATSVRKSLPSALWLPWLLTNALDLHYPQARGNRPFGHGFLMGYIARLLELTSTNEGIYRDLGRVLSLKAGLWTILKPTVSIPVAANALKALVVPLAKRANTDTLPVQVGGDRQRPPS